jgi:hypothetical protein
VNRLFRSQIFPSPLHPMSIPAASSIMQRISIYFKVKNVWSVTFTSTILIYIFFARHRLDRTVVLSCSTVVLSVMPDKCGMCDRQLTQCFVCHERYKQMYELMILWCRYLTWASLFDFKKCDIFRTFGKKGTNVFSYSQRSGSLFLLPFSENSETKIRPRKTTKAQKGSRGLTLLFL